MSSTNHEIDKRRLNEIPVGASRIVVERDGDVGIPSQLTVDDLADKGVELGYAEFGTVPEPKSSIVAVAENLGMATATVVRGPLIHDPDDSVMVEYASAGVPILPSHTGTVDLVNANGDIVAVGPYDYISVSPTSAEAKPLYTWDPEGLSSADARSLELILAGNSRLQFDNGGIKFLLGARPDVDPGTGSEPKELVLRTRLAMHRLISDMKKFVLLGRTEYGNISPIQELEQLYKASCDDTMIIALQRAIVGGETGENASPGDLGHKLQKKVTKKGLTSRETTDSVSIVLKDGSMLITDNAEIDEEIER